MMTIRTLQSLVAAVLVLTVAGAANANYPHSICRWTGIGWSDGYHSHAACPPRPHAVAKQGVAVPVGSPNALPWWMTPASGAEQVPTPAPVPGDDSSGVGKGVVRR